MGIITFRTAELTEADRPAWERLWERSPRYLGQRWDWCDIAATGVGRPVRLGVKDPDGKLLAAVSFVERRHRVFLEWRHPAPLAFAGMLIDREPSESYLRDLLGAIAAGIPPSVTVAEILFQPELTDLRGLLWAGWQASPHYNYVSEVKAAQSLRENAVSATRRWATKGTEQGFVVVTGSDAFDRALALWDRTRERKQLPNWESNALYRKAIKEEGLITAGVVANPATGKDLAGAILFTTPGRVYYTLGASGEDAAGAPAMLQFALTEALFAQQGAYKYDWVGANTPVVAQFKKDFRPGLEVYMRAMYRSKMRKFLNPR